MPSFGSTPGGASILITSAPKSARMRQQVGPARTRVRSRTRRWSSADEAIGRVMMQAPVAARDRRSRSERGRAIRSRLWTCRTRSRRARSEPGRPTICMATGKPRSSKPAGSATAGKPSTIDPAGEAAHGVERLRREAVGGRIAFGGARRVDRHDRQHGGIGVAPEPAPRNPAIRRGRAAMLAASVASGDLQSLGEAAAQDGAERRDRRCGRGGPARSRRT